MCIYEDVHETFIYFSLEKMGFGTQGLWWTGEITKSFDIVNKVDFKNIF